MRYKAISLTPARHSRTPTRHSREGGNPKYPECERCLLSKAPGFRPRIKYGVTFFRRNDVKCQQNLTCHPTADRSCSAHFLMTSKAASRPTRTKVPVRPLNRGRRLPAKPNLAIPNPPTSRCHRRRRFRPTPSDPGTTGSGFSSPPSFGGRAAPSCSCGPPGTTAYSPAYCRGPGSSPAGCGFSSASSTTAPSQIPRYGHWPLPVCSLPSSRNPCGSPTIVPASDASERPAGSPTTPPRRNRSRLRGRRVNRLPARAVAPIGAVPAAVAVAANPPPRQRTHLR